MREVRDSPLLQYPPDQPNRHHLKTLPTFCQDTPYALHKKI